MLFQSKKIPYFGLDISDLSFKLVGLLKTKKGPELQHFNYAAVPPDYFANGKIVKIEETARLIQELVRSSQGGKLKTRFVHACLPEKHTFIKLISVPQMSASELPAAVEWAAEHHLPFSLDEIYFDWQVVGKHPEKNDIHIVIGAAPKETVESYTKMLKLAELVPLSLEIEAVSIVRALLNDQLQNNTEATAIIDLGATRSSFIVFAHNAVQFTASLPFSGQQINEIIARKLSLKPKEAESAKIVCGIDPERCIGGVRTILDNELKVLGEKISNSAAYYQQNFDDALPIKRGLLSGGGAQMKALDTFLTDKTGIDFAVGNPLRKIRDTKRLVIPPKQLLSFTTAIGLALK